MYRLSDAVRSTCNQDGGIVLDVRLGQMFRVNPVGALILEALKAWRSEDEITAAVACGCRTNAGLVQPDVRSFLQELENCGIVQRTDDVRLP